MEDVLHERNIGPAILGYLRGKWEGTRQVCNGAVWVSLSRRGINVEIELEKDSYQGIAFTGCGKTGFGSRKPMSGAKARPILKDLAARLKSCPSQNLFPDEFSSSL